MLRLQTVNHIESVDCHTLECPGDLLHSTSVLKYLVLLWTLINRGVCADSYFVSVTSAQTLMDLGLRFIGFVKTIRQKFLMKYLFSLKFEEGRGKE